MENKKNQLKILEKLYFSVTKDKALLQSFLNHEVFLPFSVDIQEEILNLTVRNPVSKNYPPPLSYRRFFLRTLIDKVESLSSETSDCLIETYAEIVSQRDGSKGFCSYELNEDCIITLEENSCFVTNGTTGLQTWEASKYLAEWCMENKHLLKNKSIIELGCGIGLLGMAVLKTCDPEKYIFTDNSWDVLKVLSSNLSINFPNLDNTVVEKHQLAWCEFSSSENQLNSDIILGADIVFDIEMTNSLVSALQHLLKKPSSKAFMSLTIRNTETNEHFLLQLAKYKLECRELPGPQKSIFLYNPNSIFILYEIYLKMC